MGYGTLNSQQKMEVDHKLRPDHIIVAIVVVVVIVLIIIITTAATAIVVVAVVVIIVIVIIVIVIVVVSGSVETFFTTVCAQLFSSLGCSRRHTFKKALCRTVPHDVPLNAWGAHSLSGVPPSWSGYIRALCLTSDDFTSYLSASVSLLSVGSPVAFAELSCSLLARKKLNCQFSNFTPKSFAFLHVLALTHCSDKSMGLTLGFVVFIQSRRLKLWGKISPNELAQNFLLGC